MMDTDRLPSAGDWRQGAAAVAVLSFDVDAEAPILAEGAHYTEDLSTMSHQAYGPRVGVPRILEQDVREEALVPSDKQTQCPYKGVASYYSVEVGGEQVEDLIWYYSEPIPETAKMKGHLAFFNEKVDLEVDGEEQERPQTQWS